MKMKKYSAVLIATILVFITFIPSLCPIASAESDIIIYVNDEVLNCEVTPFIKDGRTMVPMRKIFEALNAKVVWDGTTRTITATKEEIEIVLQINNQTMYHNGVAETLDVAPVIVNDSTFVPIRAVSQSLNATVDWFGHTKTVYINSKKTYNDEYNSLLELYMQATVPAGYEWFETVTDHAIEHSDICVQGFVSEVHTKDNDVYLIMNNRYSEDEKIAIYISDTESTSIETMTKLFKETNISLGGRYLGFTESFCLPTVDLQYVSIFESDAFYDIYELTYPELSLLGQTTILYSHNNEPHPIPVTKVEEYLEAGWTKELQVTMFAPDGRSLNVPESEVEAYQNVGWYLHPVTIMYASDGRTLVVPKDEINDYTNVGWYETYEEALAANRNSVNNGWQTSDTEKTEGNHNNNNNWQSSDVNQGETVYVGHTGNKYHTKNCRTLKNGAIPMSLSQAKAEGRTACKVCH